MPMFYPADRACKKRQNLVAGCLLKQNLGENIYWINLNLFAIHVRAYLCGELMLQLAQSNQHFYHDGCMLEWLSGCFKLPCTYRQIVSNTIEDSRPFRQRHSGLPFAQDLRIQVFNHGILSVMRCYTSYFPLGQSACGLVFLHSSLVQTTVAKCSASLTPLWWIRTFSYLSSAPPQSNSRCSELHAM